MCVCVLVRFWCLGFCSHPLWCPVIPSREGVLLGLAPAYDEQAPVTGAHPPPTCFVTVKIIL